MSIAPGTRLGPYEVLAKIGEGGMGDVYRATDTRLGRTVAIKTSREEFSERFEREARAVAALNHPNICQLYDVGPNYLVMEFVDGTPVQPPGDRSRLLDAATQISDALVVAHAAGIVHRDLKPDNILQTRDGRVKVLDFGLATGGLGSSAPDALATQAATAVGTTVGTVAYMSPEQTRGEAVDSRSDLWSLGVVLYELATGGRPFGGATAAVVFDGILNQSPPPLRDSGAHVPSGFAPIVAKLLEKDRARRYQSAADLRTDLMRLAQPNANEYESSDYARSVAVLPFANMSADSDNEYFCDGIAEEITSALSKVTQLRVAGRTSAFSFKGKTGDLREIGRTLNVASVLEGSVRKAGNRLRITAQLVKVTDGYRLWSERYDRQMEDIFEIQDEIALAVVEAMKVTLLGAEKAAVVKRFTDNAEAYNLCLKARHAWNRWTDDGFRMANQLFQRALDLDPNYALAHMGLADCCLAWDFIGRQLPDSQFARTSLETALRLDPTLAEAHAILAIVEGFLEFNWQAAAERCRKALEMDPRNAHLYAAYGEVLQILGRHDDSIAAYRRSIELDPLNPFWNALAAMGFLGTQDFAAAIRQADATLDLAPDYWWAHVYRGGALQATGRLDEAIRSFEKAAATSGDVSFVLGHLGHALAASGRREDALACLARIEERSKTSYVSEVAPALVHAGLNDLDRAFDHLERAVAAHDIWCSFALALMPVETLRQDARFAELRRRIGL